MNRFKMLLPLLAVSVLTANTGASLYKKKCAGCHGYKGEKHALGHSHSIHGMPPHKVIELMQEYATGKKKGMPIAKSVKKHFMKKYSTEEINAVANYISKLQ